MKKIATLLLALVMVMSLAITGFAAMEGTLTGGSITIINPVEGQTYNAYQILYIESYDATNNVYSYKANAAWKSWLKTQTQYVTVDDQDYVTWVDAMNNAQGAAEFAELAKAQLAGMTADGTATAAEGTTTVTISNLNLGYYLVNTTLGTLCSLDTTNPTVEMTEKNEAPESDKKVKEDSTNNWGDTNDADIGQVVEYKSEIKVKAGAVNYKFRDTMSAGLTLDASSIKVQIDGVEVAAVNYTLKTGTNAAPYTFTIAFDNEWIATQVGKAITITYSATLNENAVIADDGNKNTAELEYGNKAEDERDTTPPVNTVTKTWKFDVEKFTNTTTGKVNLAGATFTLSKNEKGTDPIALIALGNNVYRVAKDGEAGSVTSITTDATGKFTIQGLDSDTYYLTETVAPTGYNKLAGPVKVVIAADGTVSKDTTVATNGLIEIENKAGSELPSTGGMGTQLFYVIGGIMVLAAVVLLVTKKRMASAE